MHRFVLVRHASARSGAPEALLSREGRIEAEALAHRMAGWHLDATWSSDLPRAMETARILLSHRTSPELRRSPALREVEPPPGSSPTEHLTRYAAWESVAIPELAENLSRWLNRGCGLAGQRPPLTPTLSPGERGTGRHGDTETQGRGDGGTGGQGHTETRGHGDAGRRKTQFSVLSPQSSACSTQHSALSTVLVVSHGGPLRVLICLLLRLPPSAHWSFHLDHAGITVVDRCEDMGTLMLLNDRCHLKGEYPWPPES